MTSAVAPARVGGTATTAGVSSALPGCDARWVPPRQSQAPVFLTRQISWIVSPGCTTVPSGTVTASTNPAARMQPISVITPYGLCGVAGGYASTVTPMESGGPKNSPSG